MQKYQFNNPISLQEALEKINENTFDSYIWFPVKTSNGNIIEVGGTQKELAFEFIELDSNSQICSYTNDFTRMKYKIVFEKGDKLLQPYCFVETHSSRAQLEKFETLESLVQFIENTPRLNFKEIPFVPVYKQVIIGHKLDDENFYGI